MSALLGLACSIAAAADEFEFSWFAFAQLTAEYFDQGADDGISFGADRIRVKGAVSKDALSAGLLLDFNAGDLDERRPGTLPNIIKDAYAAYALSEHHSVKFGQFKSPIGMDFNLPGQSLDITKRGMEAGLAFERDLGIMLSGRKLSERFGYDIGLFNPPGRSAATEFDSSQVGDDNAWAARALYDWSVWHVEAAFGLAENAGGAGTEDYRVVDLGVTYRLDRWTAKGEWIDGRNVRGQSDRDERVFYGHLGYRFRPRLEAVIRHYDGESSLAGSDTNLTNTYAGITYVLPIEGLNGRIQVNYMRAGGDEALYTGVRGFRADTLFFQFQVLAQR